MPCQAVPQRLTFPAIFSLRMGKARPPKLLPPPVQATCARQHQQQNTVLTTQPESHASHTLKLRTKQ